VSSAFSWKNSGEFQSHAPLRIDDTKEPDIDKTVSGLAKFYISLVLQLIEARHVHPFMGILVYPPA
jgi:hypothetical protein